MIPEASLILIAYAAGFCGGVVGSLLFASYSVRVHQIGKNDDD